MLRLDMDAAALGSTRFAISPLHTTVDSLYLLHGDARAGGGWRELVLEAVRDRGLSLLASLFSGPRDYLPDFIKPEPRAQEGPVQDELHAVATVSAERLRWEIEVMVQGSPGERLLGRPAPMVLLDLLERGEGAVAERFAAELHQVWQAVVRPRWRSCAPAWRRTSPTRRRPSPVRECPPCSPACTPGSYGTTTTCV